MGADEAKTVESPWRAAGLDDHGAAVHLLNRLGYGPRPGDIERVLEMGIGPWLEWQLEQVDPGLVTRSALARLPSVAEGPPDAPRHYPHHGAVVAEAIEAGRLSREVYIGAEGEPARLAALAALDRWAAEKGHRPMADLLAEIRGQRLVRAATSETQLREVMTDFWFNHFNVTALHGETRIHVRHYVVETLRPLALGRFEDLLKAVARHPAMLLYLGNARSVAPDEVTTTFDLMMTELGDFSPTGHGELRQRLARVLGWRPVEARRLAPGGQGSNENWARELLELHTLGVEGGYTQDDVIEVARAFTGWTVLPKGRAGQKLRGIERKIREQGKDWGLVVEGDFLFRPDQHDAGAKTVLGHELAAGRGFEDGLDVLALTARHPATAHHLAHKLAVRFVDDQPPTALVERLAATWRASDGDVAQVLRTLVASPELWQAAKERIKIKSPFELVSSALRVLDARVDDPQPTMAWVTRAGEAAYTYAAPTGHDDRRASWLGVGAMLARVNFAFVLARERLPGVTFDLEALLDRLEIDKNPATDDEILLNPEDALAMLFPLVLPGRQPGEALEELMIWGPPIDPEAFDILSPEEPTPLPGELAEPRGDASGTTPEPPEPKANEPRPTPRHTAPEEPGTTLAPIDTEPTDPAPAPTEVDKPPKDDRRREGLLYYALALLLASPLFQER